MSAAVGLIYIIFYQRISCILLGGQHDTNQTRSSAAEHGREQCQTESCAPNVMDRELHPVLLVLGPAKDHPQARYSVIVKNAMELDGVVAMFVVVLAKSNQQIQKISRKAQILRRRRRSNLFDLTTPASLAILLAIRRASSAAFVTIGARSQEI